MAKRPVRLPPGKNTLDLDDRSLALEERIRLYREVYGLSDDQCTRHDRTAEALRHRSGQAKAWRHTPAARLKPGTTTEAGPEAAAFELSTCSHAIA